MPATVQGIEFEIRGNADSAATSLEQLATSLERLKQVTNSGLGIKSLAAELKSLVAAMSSMNVKGVESFAKAMSALGQVKLPNLVGASIGIKSMVSALQGVKNIDIPNEKIESIKRFADAVKAFTGVKATTINLLNRMQLPSISPDAGDNLRKFMDAVESISEAALSKLEKLVTWLSELKGVDLNAFVRIMQNLDKAESSARKTSSALSALPKIANAGFQSLSKAVDNTVKSVLKLATYPLQLLTSALKNVAKSVVTAPFRLLASTLQSVSHAVTNFAKNAVQKLVTGLTSAAAASGKFIANIAVAPIARLADTIKRLTSRIDTMVSSFKRVLFYRVIRTIIKEIGDALKEGTENAYWYTKLIGDTTHYISEAFDTFASASYKMENQIGAAWATLFAMIQPILIQVIALVTRAVEALTMFFAALSGKQTYLKATDFAKDWAESTEKATEAAKEWRNQLMGFDEINRLEEPNNSDRSSAKDKIPDYGAMFEEADIDLGISDLADQIRDAFESQRWKELGELIAKTLSGLFPSEAKWKEWGTKVGKGINGVIQTLYSMLKALDFRDFGNRLAEFFNSAINEIDFNTWGRLIIRKLTAALDFAIGFLERLDFGAVGKAIGDYFRGALDEATEWLDSYDWGKVSSGLWERIKALIDGFDVASFANSLGTFLVTGINSAADFLNGIDFTDVVNTVISTLGTFFGNLRIEDVETAIGNLWEALKTAFSNSMSAFGQWLSTVQWGDVGSNLFTALSTGVSELIAVARTVPWGEIWSAIETTFSSFMTSFGAWLVGIDWVETGANFTTSAMTLLGELKRVVTEVIPWGEIWEAIKGFLTGVKLTITAGDTGWDLSKLTDSVVVQKLIDSLRLLFGMKVGFTIGGVPGAIVGTIFGLKIDSIINGIGFNNGTTIGESALSALLMPALNYLVGGIAGLVFTGSASGFFMGSKMALALTAGIDLLDFIKGNNAEVDGTSFVDTFKELMTIGGLAVIGAKIGASVGGLTGGVLGFTIGAVLGVVISAIKFSDHSEGGIDYGGPSGFQFGDYIRAEKEKGNWPEAVAVGEEIGETVAESTENTLRKSKEGISAATSEMAGAVPTAFSDSQPEIQSALDENARIIDNAYGDMLTSTTTNSEQIQQGLTTVFESIGSTADQTFLDMETNISTHLQNIVDNVNTKVAEIGDAVSGLATTIQSAMNFEWAIPRPKLPMVYVSSYDSFTNPDGSIVSLPRFDVQWYAKGGIVDGATLIGAGEAGKEAIIPLERNTEWISKVAAEMNAQMERSGDTAEDMRMAVYEGVMAAMSMQDSQEQAPAEVHVYLDSREIRASQRRYDRAMGVV